MKRIVAAAVMTIGSLAGAEPAAAQAPPGPVSGFLVGGISTDGQDHAGGAAVGLLVDVAKGWVSVGAQGDLFFSGGYFAGRGGPMAQLNIVRRGPLRLFGMGGMSWGWGGGAMVGAGAERRLGDRIGVRASVQDYLRRKQNFSHGGQPFTQHQISVQGGIVFK